MDLQAPARHTQGMLTGIAIDEVQRLLLVAMTAGDGERMTLESGRFDVGDQLGVVSACACNRIGKKSKIPIWVARRHQPREKMRPRLGNDAEASNPGLMVSEWGAKVTTIQRSGSRSSSEHVHIPFETANLGVQPFLRLRQVPVHATAEPEHS